MTNLPATFVQGQAMAALAYARDWITSYREPPHGVFHRAFEATLKMAMRAWALHCAFGMDEIALFAEHGSQEAKEVLDEIFAERLERGEWPGAVLAAYDIRRKNPGRPKKSGPSKLDNFRRDIGISLLVKELIDRFKLRARHNPASCHPSACAVAAQALTEAGLGPISDRGVARVWGRYGPMMTGHFPPSYRFLA
jgi:hypothetical protein